MVTLVWSFIKVKKLKYFLFLFFVITNTMNANKFSAIIIGDRVITKIMDNKLRITPLKWFQKSNSSLHPDTIMFETNKEASRVLSELSDGTICYDDLVKMYV